jgi:2-polyprenyl-6-methoxyphenol hydroxylase-like FAD-dependent oxidoreductase
MVIGGGPAGLTAAIALRWAAIDVSLYERAPAGSDAGTGLTLWPNALKALELIGAADAVRASGAPCDGIALSSWRGDVLNRTPRELMERRFGGAGVALHRGELTRTLHALVGQGVVSFGARCSGFRVDASGVTALFADGRTASADLLVGADGIRSTIRAQLFGPSRLRYAGYPVFRGIAEFPLAAGERMGQLVLGRGAQFGLFPMTRGRVYWFASVDAPPGSWKGRDCRPELLERFAQWREPASSVIAATPEDCIVVSDVYDRRPIRRWSGERVVLVGDAAHPSTPNLGQGACQAIEDAVVLARCLDEEESLGAALRAYERRRRARANATVRQARRMGRVGQWKNPLACWMRDGMIARTPERAQLRQLERMFTFEP